MTWEHLQDVWSKIHNRRVRTHFRDLVNDPDRDDLWANFDAQLDISIPRHSLYQACTIREQDTSDMTLLRTFMFWVVLGQASALQQPIYAIPSDRYQQQVKFTPQVTLYFKEDLADIEDGYAPIDAEVSFRVMGETGQTLSQANLNTLANKIRTEFALAGGYRWRKGRTKINYRNQEQGYLLTINAFSEAEGRQLIDKILDIQNHTIDLSKLTVQTMAETPPIVPPMHTVLGRSRRQPRKRPVGWVRFIYADLHIWGIPEAVCLVDRSGRRRTPIIAA